MSQAEILRAWEDPGFRATLTPDQLAQLPPNPAGSFDALLASLELDGPVSDDQFFWGLGTPTPCSEDCCGCGTSNCCCSL